MIGNAVEMKRGRRNNSNELYSTPGFDRHCFSTPQYPPPAAVNAVSELGRPLKDQPH